MDDVSGHRLPLLTLGATCAARSVRLHGAPVRFIWATALILSLLIPAVMSSVSVTLPRLTLLSTAEPARTVALRDLAPKFVAPSVLLRSLPQPGPVSATLNLVVARMWAALSLLLAAAAIVNAGPLGWRKRRWAKATLGGTPVLVAPDAGRRSPACCFEILPFQFGCWRKRSKRSATSSRTNAQRLWPSAIHHLCPRRCARPGHLPGKAKAGHDDMADLARPRQDRGCEGLPCALRTRAEAGLPADERRKQFFFEKKNQKTFISWLTLPERTATAT